MTETRQKAAIKPRWGKRQPVQIKTTEDAEQIALMAWARCKKFDESFLSDYLMHIPNGGARSPREGAKFKRMGVMKGFPDLFLFVPNAQAAGLFIELKAKGGKVQPSQKNVMRRLGEQGYECVVAYGASQAIAEIERYLAEA